MRSTAERRAGATADPAQAHPAPPGELTSVYHDTADLRLLAGGILLSRRDAGGQAVWRLELPAGDRQVLESSAPDERVPGELAGLLIAHTRGRPLAPVATLTTGVEGAEVCFDAVPRRERDEPAPDDVRGQVQAALRADYDRILRHDPATRLGGDPEAVHQERVATRRMRAVLRSARPLVDRPWADGLRAPLRRAGRVLGEVRDVDVMLESLTAELGELPADQRLAGWLLVSRLEDRRDSNQAALARTLARPWFMSLLDRLEIAVDEPRFRGKPRSLEGRAASEHRKARKLVRKLSKKPADDELHEVRKAVKRARYTAELAAAGGGKPVRRYVKRAKRVQDVLGEHQDVVTLRATLEELRAAAESPAERAAADGLVALQKRRMKAARKAFPKAWRQLDRRGRKLA
jgi:CHAD domain-containing protein